VSIKVTIAVPTHNRAASLAATLASVAAQRFPREFEPECLIVDNGSSDDTALVVAKARSEAAFPIRCVREERLGSSFARNRAIAQARGDYILFIDDDAVADPVWAHALVAEIEGRALEAACGMVVPDWEIPPPRWLGPSLYVRLAVHDEVALAQRNATEIETIHNYFSANAGFPRRTFELYGRFREDLGVVGKNPMSGEDTELFERIIAHGGRIGFAASARVHHRIGRERMTRAYLRHKAFAFGAGTANGGGAHHNRFDKLVRNSVRMMISAARGDTEAMVRHELECANFFGFWLTRLLCVNTLSRTR
jgi:glycosyltransferase involved in cell wall biosynthesis